MFKCWGLFDTIQPYRFTWDNIKMFDLKEQFSTRIKINPFNVVLLLRFKNKPSLTRSSSSWEFFTTISRPKLNAFSISLSLSCRLILEPICATSRFGNNSEPLQNACWTWYAANIVRITILDNCRLGDNGDCKRRLIGAIVPLSKVNNART